MGPTIHTNELYIVLGFCAQAKMICGPLRVVNNYAHSAECGDGIPLVFAILGYGSLQNFIFRILGEKIDVKSNEGRTLDSIPSRHLELKVSQ